MTNKIIPPAPVVPAEPRNFMYALMKAIEHDQQTMSQQQLTDAQSTLMAVNFQTAIYAFWKERLQTAADNVDAASRLPADERQEKTEAAQAQFNLVSAKSQMYESQQKGMLDSTQGQTATDAQNLAAKAQIQQAANSIGSMLSQLLTSM